MDERKIKDLAFEECTIEYFFKYQKDIRHLLQYVYEQNVTGSFDISEIVEQKLSVIPSFIGDGSAYIVIGIKNIGGTQRVCLLMWAYQVGKDELHLTQFVVSEDQQGKGYATGALGILEEEARRRGVKKITLNVRVKNEHAMNTYQKKGYEVESVRMTKDV